MDRPVWTQQKQIQHQRQEPQLDADGNPVEAAPTVDWDADDNPYKQRFESYRSEADRRATEYQQTQSLLADLQSEDAEKQRAAAEKLGFDLVGDEPDPEHYDDPLEELRANQAKLEAKIAEQDAKLAERDKARENENMLAMVNDRLEQLGLDKDDGDWVLARATMLPPDATGLPDLKTAYDELVARDGARAAKALEDWRAGKRAPAITPGQQATEQKNVLDMTDAERIEWAVEQAEIRAARS